MKKAHEMNAKIEDDTCVQTMSACHLSCTTGNPYIRYHSDIYRRGNADDLLQNERMPHFCLKEHKQSPQDQKSSQIESFKYHVRTKS